MNRIWTTCRAKAGGVYRSSDQSVHHFPKHIRQPEIPALESIGELGVLEAQKPKNGRVHVVNVDGVGRCIETEVVGFAESDSGLGAAAREPHGGAVVESAQHHWRKLTATRCCRRSLRE